jgi:O-methyltransferase
MAGQGHDSADLLGYVRDVSLRDCPVLYELREFTAELPAGRAMQVMAEEGQFLALLVRLVDARAVVEIGTFTGYSALCMARALPPDGILTTCDITDRWPLIGAEYWRRAGVDDRIEVLIGDARDSLAKLIAERGEGHADIVFIDADKVNYPAYYEAALTLARPGGLIVIDNTLFFGRVANPEADDPDTVAVRELNLLLKDDERIDLSLLPMADGITLARKR